MPILPEPDGHLIAFSRESDEAGQLYCKPIGQRTVSSFAQLCIKISLVGAQRRGLAVIVGRGEVSDYESGVAAAKALLDRPSPPQAVFCVNDLLALGLIDYARRERRLAVPEDLSVIGFDDIPQASWGAYRLTTFRQDPVVTADQAIRLIEWRQAHPGLPSATHVIEAPMVLRETAVPAPGLCADARPAGEALTLDEAGPSGRSQSARTVRTFRSSKAF